jgi:type III pantothenate kinase
MILAIDAGNSCLHAAIFEGKRMKERLWEEHKDLLSQIKEFCSKYEGRIKKVCCCTPPHWQKKVERVCKRLFGIHPLFLKASSQKILQVHYKEPDTLGADRVANAIGAKLLRLTPCIIVDAGSATTVDVVLEEGFVGGVIIPSPIYMGKALSSIKPLPFVKVERVDVLGRSTTSCITSGIYHGFLGAVKEVVSLLKERFSEASLVGKGGYVGLLKDGVRFDVIKEDLTLLGLMAFCGCG